MKLQKKTTKSIIKIFSRLLIVVGFVGLFSGIILSSGLHRIIPDSFEMPLGDLRGIAVDLDGNIYCGTKYYSRIQVYDIEGKFLYGKYISSSMGIFKIKINSNDQLEVAIYSGDKKYIFAKDGTLLSKSSNKSYFLLGFENINDYYCYDEKRDIAYQIKPILFPFDKLKTHSLISPLGSHVKKIDKSGKETVIIKTPFYKWLFMAPFPSFLFILIGGLVYSISIGKKVKLFFWTINKDSRDINSIDDMRVDNFNKLDI